MNRFRFYRHITYAAIYIALALCAPAPVRATTILDDYRFQLFGDATLETSPAVVLTANAAGGSGSVVTLWYNWTVTCNGGGPAGLSGNCASSGSLIDILFTANASVSTTAYDDHSDARSIATIDVRSPVDSKLQRVICASPGGGSCSNTFGDTLAIVGVLDWVHSFSLDVNVSTFGAGVASGYLDPVIFVDPNFPNADLYSIVLSPGVANALPSVGSSVPEPGTFWLLGSSVGLALLPRWRRRSSI